MYPNLTINIFYGIKFQSRGFINRKIFKSQKLQYSGERREANVTGCWDFSGFVLDAANESCCLGGSGDERSVLSCLHGFVSPS
jgi:hypothetical protein